jgi:hypothetical protein
MLAAKLRAALASGKSWPALVFLVLIVACGGCSKAPEGTQPAPGEWRTFEGDWSATGERHTLHLGPGHWASIYNLTGSMLLKDEKQMGMGFQGRVIVLSDNVTGGIGRCVWTNENGDQVFSEIKIGSGAHGVQIVGTIIGGTGRFAGVNGTYEFKWQYLIEAEEGVIQGRAVGLKGRYRIGTPAATPPTGKSGQ